MREAFRVPDDFELVREGMGANTFRDLRSPRFWAGLSGIDRALLWAFVDGVKPAVRELHTDVPLGVIPKWSGADGDAALERLRLSVHPLRVDAVVNLNGQWFVCEVKPDAGYLCLGQVLTYEFYAPICIARLAGCARLVVTDYAQGAIAPLFERYDVGVAEVGEATGEQEVVYRNVSFPA